MFILRPLDITLLFLKWNMRVFCLGRAWLPLLAQLCAAPQFLMPVQNASSSHPLPVTMVIAVEPGLHLAGPAKAERPLTCPRGLLGSKAGLPRAVTQRRLERGRQGQGRTDMAQLWGGLWGFNKSPGCRQGGQVGCRAGGAEWPPGRREAQRRLREARIQGKGLRVTFCHTKCPD